MFVGLGLSLNCPSCLMAVWLLYKHGSEKTREGWTYILTSLEGSLAGDRPLCVLILRRQEMFARGDRLQTDTARQRKDKVEATTLLGYICVTSKQDEIDARSSGYEGKVFAHGKRLRNLNAILDTQIIMGGKSRYNSLPSELDYIWNSCFISTTVWYSGQSLVGE